MENEIYVACSTQGRAQERTRYTLFVQTSSLGTHQMYDHTLDRSRLLSIRVTQQQRVRLLHSPWKACLKLAEWQSSFSRSILLHEAGYNLLYF
jgi:hypothetical protein